MAHVYILRSLKNDRFYIGSTNDIKRRIHEHQSGASSYTKRILPVEVVFTQEYPTLHEARSIERWLKKQKDSRFIQRIITEGNLKKVM
jgi:putative endonuclease